MPQPMSMQLSLIPHDACYSTGRDYHCELIGYQHKNKPQASISPLASSYSMPRSGIHQSVVLNQSSTATGIAKASVAVPCQRAATNSSFVEGAGQSTPNSEGTIGQGKMLEIK